MQLGRLEAIRLDSEALYRLSNGTTPLSSKQVSMSFPNEIGLAFASFKGRRISENACLKRFVKLFS